SSSDCSLELNNPVLLWKCNNRPAYSKEMYNFTNYAVQLNELLPGQDKQFVTLKFVQNCGN
ncbi:Oxysterol-binding protein-related protein 2, partial [Exaiptasia diaphana]